jgi:protein-S-isoprenylcysteine O-methyltransferase Ste14
MPGGQAMKRLMPPTYLGLSIVLMVLLHFVFPVTRIMGFPWNLLGLGPLISGIAINLIADRAFKTRGTTVKPFEASSALVTEGVFRLSRHPMYFGFVLVLLGIAVLVGSLTPFAVVVAFGVLMDRVFIPAEEAAMETTFGTAWLGYKAKVRRWI